MQPFTLGLRHSFFSMKLPKIFGKLFCETSTAEFFYIFEYIGTRARGHLEIKHANAASVYNETCSKIIPIMVNE